MAIATTITISGVVYDVYGLTSDPVGDADDYHGGSLSSAAVAWAAAVTLTKQKAIIQATRWIDDAVRFSGTKTVASQALEWPRDSATCNGTAITDGTIPDGIALATFELAALLIVDADADSSTGEGSNIKRVKAGSAEVEFFENTIGSAQDTALPILVHRIIKCYLGGGLVNEGGVSYGVDCDSAFDNDNFRRSQGFDY